MRLRQAKKILRRCFEADELPYSLTTVLAAVRRKGWTHSNFWKLQIAEFRRELLAGPSGAKETP